MNPFSFQNVPNYIRKELEEIQHRVKPLLKKSAGFSFVSIPLVGFSLVNILFLLFIQEAQAIATPFLILFAVSGAVGMALFKESRIQNKEIHVKGIQYMSERINSSTFVSDDNKDLYIRQIQSEPALALKTFCEFLSQEERMRKFTQVE